MRYFLSILFISLLYPDYAGGYAGSSFRFGFSAREISLSNSMVSVKNPGFNAFSNPALISDINGTEFGSSLFLLSNDRNIQSFSVSRGLPPKAGAGISFFRAGVNNIVGINSDEEYTGDLGYGDGFLMLSFGISFNKYLSTGINIKALFQHFNISKDEKYASNGLAFDLGLYSSPINNLGIGLKIENFNGKYYWNERITSDSGSYEEEIPVRVTIGGSYLYLKSFLFLLQHEIILLEPDIGNSQRSSIALEYNYNISGDSDSYIPILFRFGLRQNQWAIIDDKKEDMKLNPALGIGSKIKFINNKLLSIDYTIQYSELGFNNLFSISTRL